MPDVLTHFFECVLPVNRGGNNSIRWILRAWAEVEEDKLEAEVPSTPAEFRATPFVEAGYAPSIVPDVGAALAIARAIARDMGEEASGGGFAAAAGSVEQQQQEERSQPRPRPRPRPPRRASRPLHPQQQHQQQQQQQQERRRQHFVRRADIQPLGPLPP